MSKKSNVYKSKPRLEAVAEDLEDMGFETKVKNDGVYIRHKEFGEIYYQEMKKLIKFIDELNSNNKEWSFRTLYYGEKDYINDDGKLYKNWNLRIY